MEGFIIASLNEETGELERFWDGNSLIDDVAKAKLFINKIDGRLALGGLQGQVPNSELRLVSARLTITLVAQDTRVITS